MCIRDSMKGSFTICEKAVATAASKALPPFARMAAPTSAARGWGQTTTPFMDGPPLKHQLAHAREASTILRGRYNRLSVAARELPYRTSYGGSTSQWGS